MSSRMGAENKLLVEIDGVPMVRRAAEAMIEGGIRQLVVVTGHEAEHVAAVLDGFDVPDLDLRLVHNPVATARQGRLPPASPRCRPGFRAR